MPVTPVPVAPVPVTRPAATHADDCRGEPRFARQPASNPYGMNVNALAYQPGDPFPDTAYATAATMLRAAGTGWVRVDVDWSTIGADPASRTSDAAFRWSRLDQTVSRARCRGLNVLGVLEYTPAWAVTRPVADGGRRQTDLPDDLRDWARFVRAAVERYPDVRAWAVWNEPNVAVFFNGRRGAIGPNAEGEDALIADYAGLVAAAAPWIRRPADGRGARLLVAPEAARGGAERWVRGLLQTQRQGANVDVVSMHHYSDAADIARTVRALPEASGVRPWAWPVWLTEAGPVGCLDRANARAAGENVSTPSYCAGYRRARIQADSQAAHLRTLMTAMTSGRTGSPWAKTFYWHGFLDVYDSTSTPMRGDDRGIVRGLQRGAARASAALGALRALSPAPAAAPR